DGPDRAGAGLSFCAAAANDQRGPAGGHDHLLLAHSLAQPRSIRDLSVARRAARWLARQHHSWISYAVSRQQLRRHGRPAARGPRGSRGLLGHLSWPADVGAALSHFGGMAAAPGA